MHNLFKHKRKLTICLLFLLLLTSLSWSVFVATPVHSQEEGVNGEPQLPALGEANLPVIFSADFDQGPLDTATWVYNTLRARLVRADGETRRIGANNHLQLWHATEWSTIALDKGAGWRDYIVEMDVRFQQPAEGADEFSLGVRYKRDQGDYAISFDLAAQMVKLSSTIDGLWEGTLIEVPMALDPNRWYRLEVRAERDLISFIVDDTFIGTIQDASLPEGSIHMMSPPESMVYVDNVVVREIPSSPDPGELLVSEFFFRNDTLQWFEIVNVTERHLRLDGVELASGGQTHHIVAQEALILTPGSFTLFASEDPGAQIALKGQKYIYGDSPRFPLDNGNLRISFGGQTIAQIEYSEATGWPLQDGVSVALHADYFSARRQNNGINWCPSVQRLSPDSSTRATPGRPNHICVRELPFHDLAERQTGELVITEIMVDMPGPDQGREWFELYNTTDSAVTLKGLTIATDSPAERHTILEDFVVPPKGYAVLAQVGLVISELSSDLPVYYYPGNLKLRNTDGELSVIAGARLLDSVTWRENGWWPFRGGVSMSLHPDALSAYSNDDALNWCRAWTRIESSPEILATPGARNDSCPMWEINSPLQDMARAYELAMLTPIEVHISADPDDLERMHANPFSDTEYPAQFSAAGYNVGESPNATIRPRGGLGTRTDPIKSYRLYLEEPFWGQQSLHLNKHLGDVSRLRNALSFRLFATMDNIIGVRTQFVHLFVNGEDNGLYTMTETPGPRFLRNHRLDDRGHLFKIGLPSGTLTFFHYTGYEKSMRDNSILTTAEIEAGYTHNGLTQMIDAVYSDMDTYEIIERHFNRDNLFTYFSLLYLMENPDTVFQNYMLYSTPREPARFYYIPWDWDNAFMQRDGRSFYQALSREGFSNWAGIGVFKRILQEPGLVDELLFRMVDLAQDSLAPEHVSALVDQLVAEVMPFTLRQPEVAVMTPSDLEAQAAIIKSIIPDSAHRLDNLLERPISVPDEGMAYSVQEGAITFSWYETFDLQGDPLSYEVVLFSQDDWDENAIVWRTPRTTETSITIRSEDIPDEVSAGRYYWMVYVWDDKGNYNISANVDSFAEIDNIVDLP